MILKLYQVDAFTNSVFSGNPAAVCPLESWLTNETMQNIAMENNLAETAFYVKNGDFFEIRWFTPTVEVDLCGHATLAAAFVIFNHENYTSNSIKFKSQRSGYLTVEKRQDVFTLDFPTDELQVLPLEPKYLEAFDIHPKEIWKGKTDFLYVFEYQDQIINLQPNFAKILGLGGRGVIVTSKGKDVDFVSRFFAPQVGIDEDPVTGSAHTTLTPYWAKVLGKNEMSAIQYSKRKGLLQCKLKGSRVEISGNAKLYLKGEIYIN